MRMKIHWFITKEDRGGQRDHNSKIEKYLERHKDKNVAQVDNFLQGGKFYTVVVLGEVVPIDQNLLLQRLDQFLRDKEL